MSRKVAICFFGITRSLRYTHASIEEHVLAPARRRSSPKVYAHFFLQKEIDNPRSGEKGQLDPEEYGLLPIDWLKLEEPNHCLEQWNFEGLKAWGDSWDDEFRSLRNLIHQLHSLHTVTQAALDDGAEVCLFCRPDLRYHDSLNGALSQALQAKGDRVFLPRWQDFGGLNDRFSICIGPGAIAAYGQRVLKAEPFCRAGGEPLHSERLLKFSLETAGIPIRRIKARASRVRMDGTQFPEDYDQPWVSAAKYVLRPRLASLADHLGLRTMIRDYLRRLRP